MMSQVRADLAARKMSGSALAAELADRDVPAARQGELAAGEVDTRLMTVITGLAASHPVHVVSFGESGPNTAAAPFRSAELSESNMRNMLATSSNSRAVAVPCRAHGVRCGWARDSPVLRIDFAAPSPFGLLGSGIGNGG